MERKYGEYLPINEDVKAKIANVYGEKEEKAREIAYEVASNSTIINQELLFKGAAAINANYMKQNTIPVEGTDYLSPKIRSFNDNAYERDLLEVLDNGITVETLFEGAKLSEIPGFDKRKNFKLDERAKVFKVCDGKFKNLCFTSGIVVEKDGTEKESIFIDIANTPFEKLPKSWQKSNFDPFEFAFKLVTMYPKLSDEEAAAAVHVYWLAQNEWAIEYNSPLAKPYEELPRDEQEKDLANVLLARAAVKKMSKPIA